MREVYAYEKIRLKIVPQPVEGMATVFTKGDSDNKDPFFKGDGSYKFSCGFCDHILVQGTEFNQFNGIIFQCPRCKKYNISNNPNLG